MGQTLLSNNGQHQTTEELISTVLQLTPPIHTTRRFAQQNTFLDGQQLVAGQGVLVHLKTPEQSFAFGLGVHQCPGERWARIIASVGIDYLLALDIQPEMLSHFRWRSAQNVRVPEFYTARENNDDSGDF